MANTSTQIGTAIDVHYQHNNRSHANNHVSQTRKYRENIMQRLNGFVLETAKDRIR